jgi:hypothetical protein
VRIQGAPRNSSFRWFYLSFLGHAGLAPYVPLASSALTFQHQHGVGNGAVLGEPPQSWEPRECLPGVLCCWVGSRQQDHGKSGLGLDRPCCASSHVAEVPLASVQTQRSQGDLGVPRGSGKGCTCLQRGTRHSENSCGSRTSQKTESQLLFLVAPSHYRVDLGLLCGEGSNLMCALPSASLMPLQVTFSALYQALSLGPSSCHVKK